MPIDDLDRLLAMELGGAPEQQKISEQVSSLEAQVLSRVQKTHAPADRPAPLAKQKPSENVVPLDPIYQYIDALMPIIRTTLACLEDDAAVAGDLARLPTLRSQLADKLLTLPDINNLDKPSLFAALATCIDAAGGQIPEARRAARERLNRLLLGLSTASNDADLQRAQAIDHFAQHLSRPR
jgi:hypothetical protein